jgi:hypothetical protein
VELGLLAAILACCVVKLVILAALLVPTGFLTRNVVIGAVGVVIGLAVLVIAVRRRSRRDGTCHLPSQTPPSNGRVNGQHHGLMRNEMTRGRSRPGTRARLRRSSSGTSCPARWSRRR